VVSSIVISTVLRLKLPGPKKSASCAVIPDAYFVLGVVTPFMKSSKRSRL